MALDAFDEMLKSWVDIGLFKTDWIPFVDYKPTKTLGAYSDGECAAEWNKPGEITRLFLPDPLIEKWDIYHPIRQHPAAAIIYFQNFEKAWKGLVKDFRGSDGLNKLFAKNMLNKFDNSRFGTLHLFWAIRWAYYMYCLPRPQGFHGKHPALTDPSKLDDELIVYLQEPLVKPGTTDFDLLAWWKSAAQKYPTLSRMASDSLPIPMSADLPDGAFQVLNSVNEPRVMEALLSLGSWQVLPLFSN
ncbi:Uncharacterized protein TCM_021444 [Theobroma cacao]|uniref:HAT C-terminal dimerisation domain-containing protein n=1 Tax=Theobroma cacao TaxID=3641 RepID=A0A061EQ93_THECC|nr:Uncharacterized protein TCM_021444 [Theobroma cacao]